jgi:crotonobetainyl-CoA:carnitine CoA-transferase CaiB-like acyl-CoA transferase
MCSHEKEINRRIAAWMSERSATDVVDAFTREGAVAAIVNSPEDIARDPHIIARESIIGFPGEDAKFVNVVPKLSETPGSIQSLGPLSVGGQTLEILRDVGAYDDTSLSALLDAKAVFQT